MASTISKVFFGSKWLLVVGYLLISLNAGVAFATNKPPEERTQVIQGFTELADEKLKEHEISDESKHMILFIMGIALLVLLCTTAGFGIAMGMYGKQVFVPHMVSAGLSVTLAAAHAIAAIIWYFPL